MTPTTRTGHDTQGLAPEDVDLLLRAAVRAPSLHNSQPWAFAFGDHHVEVYADPDRHLLRADPTGRALHISCGAAVFNLRVAAAHLGMHPRVRVLPDEEDPTLVALVEVDHRHPLPGTLDGFYPAVWLRRTNRRPFRDRRIAPATAGRLAEAAHAEGAVLRVYDDENEVRRLVELVHEGDRADHDDPARVTERQAWVGGTSSP